MDGRKRLFLKRPIVAALELTPNHNRLLALQAQFKGLGLGLELSIRFLPHSFDQPGPILESFFDGLFDRALWRVNMIGEHFLPHLLLGRLEYGRML